MFEISNEDNTRINGARIKVIGVGGGGCNAVNTMIRAGLTGVEYVVANTDSQALNVSLAPTKIQLGGSITKGLGAGANPEVGRKAALEDYEKLSEVIKGADMVFITAGMGGGTGTGAAPVIAKLAKELGALTVGVITKPFLFEGKKRFKQAEQGIQNLEENVDSLITIPNQRLLYLAGDNLSLVDTFKRADEVLLNAVRGISDLINNTGHINADFADVSTVMANKGLALMGTGIATGSDRAIKAATEAISSPLLEDISINGATGIIINITGSDTLTMHETNEAVTLIMEAADENAEIIFGTVIDNTVGDAIKVTVIATGLGAQKRPSMSTTHTATIKEERANFGVETHTVSGNHSSGTFNFSNATQAAPAAPAPSQAAPSFTSSSSSSSIASQIYSAAETTFAAPIAQQAPAAQTINEQAIQAEAPRRPSFVTESSAAISTSSNSFDRFMNERPSDYAEERLTQSTVSPTQVPGQTSRLVQSIKDAASRYDNNTTRTATQSEAPQADASYRDSMNASNNRAKSIAEKLGFLNFEEDEFDTPSYMRKDERTESKPAPERRDLGRNIDV